MSLRTSSLLGCLVVGLPFVFTTLSEASIIFDQRVDVESGTASDSTDIGIAAQDFSIQSPSELNAVTWRGYYVDNSQPGADDFTIAIWDGSGVNGVPGVELATFDVGNDVNRTEVGNVQGNKLYEYSSSISPGLGLKANEAYWISIFNNAPGSGYWAWASKNTPKDLDSYSFKFVDEPWENFAEHEHYFSLEGQPATGAVPEPSTIAIWSLAGLACLGFVRFRRMQKP